MKSNRRYVLVFIFLIGFFSILQAQGKKIVFPVSVVIFSGIDSIYCFDDSLSENTILEQISVEEDFVKTLNHKLADIGDLDTNIYKPMIRFYAISTKENYFIAWERVFKYNSKIERKGIGFLKRDDEVNIKRLKTIFKKMSEK